MNWYIEVIKKYADFSGRARRKEFWYFVLFNLIISFVLGLIDGVLGLGNPEMGIGILGGVYSLAVLIPGIAVSVRRLHDTDRSGWWVLVSLVPLVGLILIVFLAQEGGADDNQYGANPKAIAA